MTTQNTKDMTKPTPEQVMEALGVIMAHLHAAIGPNQPEPEPAGEEPEPGTAYEAPDGCHGASCLLWGGGGHTIKSNGVHYHALGGGWADQIRSGAWPRIANLTELVATHGAHKELVEAVRAFVEAEDKDGNSWERVCNDYGNYPHLHTTVSAVKRLHELTRGEDQP